MSETTGSSLFSSLQCMLGILGLGSDVEESEEEESEEEEDEEDCFFPTVTLSPFLFLLRRKFPLSNIFSQFGSRVQ